MIILGLEDIIKILENSVEMAPTELNLKRVIIIPYIDQKKLLEIY